MREVLIAGRARRVNAAAVAYDAADVEKIRSFCNVRVLDPAKFL